MTKDSEDSAFQESGDAKTPTSEHSSGRGLIIGISVCFIMMALLVGGELFYQAQ